MSTTFVVIWVVEIYLPILRICSITLNDLKDAVEGSNGKYLILIEILPFYFKFQNITYSSYIIKFSNQY